jgi:aminoglycoside 6'-N-acetyltransferase
VIGLIQYWEENESDYRHAAIDIFLHPDWHGRGLGAGVPSSRWCKSRRA